MLRIEQHQIFLFFLSPQFYDERGELREVFCAPTDDASVVERTVAAAVGRIPGSKPPHANTHQPCTTRPPQPFRASHVPPPMLFPISIHPGTFVLRDASGTLPFSATLLYQRIGPFQLVLRGSAAGEQQGARHCLMKFLKGYGPTTGPLPSNAHTY